MRLRKSNKEKRFNQAAYLAELGSSDEGELQSVANRQEYDSDDGFVVDPADKEVDEDDKFDDADLDAASDPESELVSEVESVRPSRQRPLNASAKVKNTENKIAERAPGEVQPYPSDPTAKWTRTYVGPVSRHVRLRQLCEYWYGDREGYGKTINNFVLLWVHYELFPPKITRKSDLRLAKSPWVAKTFWEDQQKKLVDWYFNYLSTRQIATQSQPLQQMNAERCFLPKAETALTAYLGPFNNQEQYKITQGQAIPLAHHGAPIDEEDMASEPAGGWMLDVGGITLSMDWAPRSGTVEQLLAMTVIPYSDQAFYQTPEQAPSEADLRQGSVQIWCIPIQKDVKDTVTFANPPPFRAAALCFDGWGRAVRMQWCPVPLTIGNVIGLLAFLTTDGMIRVVEVKQSWNERTRETFGKQFFSVLFFHRAGLTTSIRGDKRAPGNFQSRKRAQRRNHVLHLVEHESHSGRAF